MAIFSRLASSPRKYHDRDLEQVIDFIEQNRNFQVSSLGSSAAKISIHDLRQIAQPRNKGYRRKMAVYSN